MEKHSSIALAEAAAACVGLILLGLVIAIIAVLVIIYHTKNKMREKSQFTIHVARNFNREKETPVSELEDSAFKSTTKISLDDRGAMDNPLYHTNSFGHKNEVVRPEVTTGFHNSRLDLDDRSSSASGPAAECDTAHVYDQPDDVDLPETFSPIKTTPEGISLGSAQPTKPVSPEKTTPSKSPIPIPKEKTTPSKSPIPVPKEKTTPSKSPIPVPRAGPNRPPPMIPIIKPKPYTGGQSSSKPLVNEKPKRPLLPPIEARGKPEVKPKPMPKPHEY